MDSSFTLQCIYKAAAVVEPGKQEPVDLASLYSIPSDVRSPSLQSSLDSIEDEDDVWVCDVCSQLNGCSAVTCVLCQRDRTAAMMWLASEESAFEAPPAVKVVVKTPVGTQTPIDTQKEAASKPMVVAGSSPPPENGTQISTNGTQISTFCTAGASPVASDGEMPEGSESPKRANKRRKVIRGGSSSFTLVCPHSDCALSFSDPHKMEEHTSTEHLWSKYESITDSKGYLTFQCKHKNCKELVKDLKAMRKHMLTHREKVFVCHYGQCKEQFFERAKLKRHFLKHSGEKPFVCTFDGCDQRFEFKAKLKSHKRSHTGAKPFGCSVANCRKRFAMASDRNTHVLSHQKHVDVMVTRSRAAAGRRKRKRDRL